jgi:hypothetical protein
MSITVLTVFHFQKWMSFPMIYRCFILRGCNCFYYIHHRSLPGRHLSVTTAVHVSLFLVLFCVSVQLQNCTYKTIPSTLEAPLCMAFLHDEALLVFFYIKNLPVQIHRVYCTLYIQSSRLSIQSPGLVLPYPFTRKRVLPPPPLGPRGEHTRLRDRGCGDPIPTMGQTLWNYR